MKKKYDYGFDVLDDGFGNPERFEVYISIGNVEPNDNIIDDNIREDTPGVKDGLDKIGVDSNDAENMFSGYRNGKTNKQLSDVLVKHGWHYESSGYGNK